MPVQMILSQKRLDLNMYCTLTNPDLAPRSFFFRRNAPLFRLLAQLSLLKSTIYIGRQSGVLDYISFPSRDPSGLLVAFGFSTFVKKYSCKS